MKNLNPLPSLRDWWERNKPRPIQPPASQMTLAMRQTREPVTTAERRAADALDKVTCINGAWDKKRIEMIAGAKNLSPGGRAMLWRLCFKYRRQINDKVVVVQAVVEHEKTVLG